MSNLQKTVGGQTEGNIQFGNHTHKPNTKCVQCEMENRAFMQLEKEGAMQLEQRIAKLPSAKAYYQKYPYDGWGVMSSFDGVFAESGHSVFGSTLTPTPEHAMIEHEASEALLEGLEENEKHIMRRTAENYKPKEIAEELGHKNSAMVRLSKWEAKRKLGVPIKINMRRTPKE